MKVIFQSFLYADWIIIFNIRIHESHIHSYVRTHARKHARIYSYIYLRKKFGFWQPIKRTIKEFKKHQQVRK